MRGKSKVRPDNDAEDLPPVLGVAPQILVVGGGCRWCPMVEMIDGILDSMLFWNHTHLGPGALMTLRS